MITLSNLKPNPGATKKRKRVGRGTGSGHGKTCGRGHKGQKARSGGAKPIWFEGGQTPLYRRIPKRGFKNPFKVCYQIVNIQQLEEKFSDGEVVSPEEMKKRGLIKKVDKPIKILAKGELAKKLVVIADAFSEKAERVIKEKGGEVKIRGDKEKKDKEK